MFNFIYLFLFFEKSSVYLALTIWNSLRESNWPPVHRDSPVSAFTMLGLKVCDTILA